MSDAVKSAAIMTLALAAGPAGWAAVTMEAFTINLAITMASQALLNKNDSGFSAKAKGRSVMFRSPAAPRQVCYGESAVSGPLGFAANSGADNKYLHLVIPIAGHQIEAIDEVYFNDKPASYFDQYATTHKVRVSCNNDTFNGQRVVTLNGIEFSGADEIALAASINKHPDFTASAAFRQVAISAVSPGVRFTAVEGSNVFGLKILNLGDMPYRINKHLGAPDQLADPDLVAEVAEWTDNHRLRGVAYLYVRFTFNADAWATGLPNIKVKLRGKNDCYDPRDSLRKYTANWALCVNDYLCYKHGFNCDASEVHNDSLVAAANISDESVEYQLGQYQPRYEVNGAFTLDESPLDVLTNLRSAGAGMCVYQFGQWRIHAGAPRVVESIGLNESDLRGSLGYQPKPNRQNLFNAVSGTFIDKDSNYQETNFPPLTNPTYQAEDSNEQIYQDVQLPFTNDAYAAQRLGKINLEYHRQPITVNYPCKIKGIRYAVGDVVPLTISALGWNNKPFEVIDWQLRDLGGPLLVLKEYASTIWDWNYGIATVVDPAPDTSLVSPRHVLPPENLQLFSGNGQLLKSSDGSVLSYILADWETKDGYALEDEVQYRKSGTLSWLAAGKTKNQELLIGPVDDGVDYDVSVRTLNSLQVPSLWHDVLNYTVIGKTELPPDPAGLSVNILTDNTRQFVITANTPVDFGGYLIRARAGMFSTWDELSVANGGLNLHDDPINASPWETAQIASGTFTLGLKLIDTSGNESLNAIITPVTFLTAPNQVTSTSQLVDDAGLGQTADWGSVSNIPYSFIYNNSDAVALGFNPTFSAWSGEFPDNWYKFNNGGVKDTTITRIGGQSIKFVCAGSNVGIYRTVAVTLPVGAFVSGTVDIYIESYTSGGAPQILFDLEYDVGTYGRTNVFADTSKIGVWQRIPFTVRVPAGEQIRSIRVFLLASHTLQEEFFGTVYYDGLDFAIFDGSTDNTVISISEDGALSGAGGGQVTITGLGFTGDLNADVTDYTDYRVSNSQTQNSVTTIANPQGGYYSGPVNNAGAIVITLPQSWTYTMMKMEVDVFNYASNKSFTAKVGGYNHSAGWVNTFAQIVGGLAANNRIRFGHNGTKCVVVIGDTSSIWQYPKVAVKNFQAGYANYAVSQWDSGWSISVVADLSGYTFTGDFPDALLDAKSILGQGALATVNQADWASQISGTGKPADNADVTTPSVTLKYYYQTAQAVAPATPSTGAGAYNFATKVATPPSGWGLTLPTAGVGKIWSTMTTYTGASQTSTTDIGGNTFTNPLSAYSLGADVTAINVKVTALLTLYYQTAQNTAPATPATGSGVYNFALKSLTTPPSGWGILPPTTGTGKVWTTVTTYAAIGQNSVTDDGSNTFTTPKSSHDLNATANTGVLADQNEVDWETQVIGHYLPDFFNRDGYYHQEQFVNLDDYTTSIPSGTSITVGAGGMYLASTSSNPCFSTRWDSRLYNGWDKSRGFKTTIAVDDLAGLNRHEVGIGYDVLGSYIRFELRRDLSLNLKVTAQYHDGTTYINYTFPGVYAAPCSVFLSAFRNATTGDVSFKVNASTGTEQNYTMSGTSEPDSAFAANYLINVHCSYNSELTIKEWHFLQEA